MSFGVVIIQGNARVFCINCVVSFLLHASHEFLEGIVAFSLMVFPLRCLHLSLVEKERFNVF